jgi:hypothetical protein
MDIRTIERPIYTRNGEDPYKFKTIENRPAFSRNGPIKIMQSLTDLDRNQVAYPKD